MKPLKSTLMILVSLLVLSACTPTVERNDAGNAPAFNTGYLPDGVAQ